MTIDVSTPEKFWKVFGCYPMRKPTVAESEPLKVIDELFVKMKEKCGLTSAQIFEQLGYDDEYVAFTKWTLDCPEEVLDYCRTQLGLISNPEVEHAPLD